MKLFISHSSQDAEIVRLLIDLLRYGLNLKASDIRCTSVDGYRLPGGARIEDQLRVEVNEVEAFIGLVSPASIQSMYVAFELGARWGANKHLIPLLSPGTSERLLTGPLQTLNALRADSASQLHQLVEDIGHVLGIQPESAAAYQKSIDAIMSVAQRLITAGNNYYTSNAPRAPSSEGETSQPTVVIEGPPSAPLGRTTYYTIISQNAVRGVYSVGGFNNNKPIDVDPLGPSHQIFVEPTDITRVGQNFSIVFTVFSTSGQSATATKRFIIVSDRS